MSDVPRSLQSWVSTIQSVVLTADVFQLLLKYQISLPAAATTVYCFQHIRAVGTRALVSCYVVALAQHFGQNRRFAQRPPWGWLRAVQNRFFAAGTFCLSRPFFRRRLDLGGGIFFLIIGRRRKKKKKEKEKSNSPFIAEIKMKANFPIRRGRQNLIGAFCYTPYGFTLF